MTEAQRKPSAVGARIAGDDYQHLFTWLQALQLLRERDGVTYVELEIGPGQNVDDLVVHFAATPAHYFQVKFVNTQGEPLDAGWLTDPRRAKQSPLEKFHASFKKLTGDHGPPRMVLETNRWPRAGDPVMACIDGQTHKLVPRLANAAAGSAAGKLRRAWAELLEIEEDELLAMLENLEIRAGRSSLDEMRRACCWLMASVGLLDTVYCVDVGMGEMRRLIREGVHRLDADALREIVAAKRLKRGDARATLLVQQLAHDPWPELATAAVDWVELFEGDEPAARRQLRDPAGWNAVLRPQLREAVAAIRAAGHRDVLIAGTLRLSTALVAGVELSDVAGFTVAVWQRDEEWSSAGEVEPVELTRAERALEQGDEVAIALAVATDLTADVEPYLRNTALPIGRLVTFTPSGGPGRSALGSAERARGLAQALIDAIRREAGGAPVHLFCAGPLGLSLLLGHGWNRMPPTQLYDDLGPGRGYAPTYQLAG